MKLLLDTNRYSDLARNIENVRQIVERAESVFLPFVVLAELRCGFAKGNRAAANDSALQLFLSKPNVSALYADDETTRHSALLWDQLRRQGTPIPVNDLWIASLCIQHELTLFARDAHFDHLPQLRRV